MPNICLKLHKWHAFKVKVKFLTITCKFPRIGMLVNAYILPGANHVELHANPFDCGVFEVFKIYFISFFNCLFFY